MAASLTASASSDMLDITGARALVEWSNPDGQTHFFPASDPTSAESGLVTLDCHFRPSSNTASFRLRAPVMLKGLGRKMIPLFIFIAPERIRSLTYDGTQKTQVSDVVRRLVGDGDVVTLRFRLSKAGDLIVPPLNPLVPKKKIFWDVFDSMKGLAQETDFLMYLRLDDVPSEDCMVSFCEAVSAGKLTTSAPHADVARLYDGKGGKLLGGDDLAVPVSAPMNAPPPYNELGSPPPAPPIEKGKWQTAIWWRCSLTEYQSIHFHQTKMPQAVVAESAGGQAVTVIRVLSGR